MTNYSTVKTTKKAGVVAGTVTVFGIASMVIASKIEPILIANGVDVGRDILIVGITTFLQSAYTAIANYLKHFQKV